MMNYNKATREYRTRGMCFQTDLGCCGSNNYTDWAATSATATCPTPAARMTPRDAVPAHELGNINTKGCLVEFEDQFVGNLGVVGGIAIGVAFVQFLTVVSPAAWAAANRKGMYV